MQQVDTSIFAMSFKKPPSHIPSEFETSSCQLDPVLLISEKDMLKTSLLDIFSLPFGLLSYSHIILLHFPFSTNSTVTAIIPRKKNERERERDEKWKIKRRNTYVEMMYTN